MDTSDRILKRTALDLGTVSSERSKLAKRLAADGLLGHWSFVAIKINDGDPSPIQNGASSSPREGASVADPQSPRTKLDSPDRSRSTVDPTDRYDALRRNNESK